MIDDLDLQRLQQALHLAEQAIGLSEPNPRVGCVLADAGGHVVAQGHTQQAGGPHAEAAALAAAREAGATLQGGTAWVTLEPCAHHGRTPPCADALRAAGLARVVVAVGDPFPQVAGAGLQRLRDAGVTVDLLPTEHPLALAARELNVGFFSRVERGRPWLRLKVAMSLDGRTALPNGVSQWITGEAARIDTHAWRRRASAVLSGSGTVLADRPRLDVRHVPTTLQPLRVALDSHLRTPPETPLLAPPGRCLLAAVHGPADAALQTRAAALQAAGAELLWLPGDEAGHVSLPALLPALAPYALNEVHIEAGATLNGALLAAGLVDELLVYLAPAVLGAGRGIAEWGPITRLEDKVALRLHAVDTVGTDLRLRFLAT